jgi:hypothetical protein
MYVRPLSVIVPFTTAQCTGEEIDSLNAKAAPHFTQSEDRDFKPDDKVKGFRASNTTVFYDLIGAVPEDTCKLLQRKVWHQGTI